MYCISASAGKICPLWNKSACKIYCKKKSYKLGGNICQSCPGGCNNAFSMQGFLLVHQSKETFNKDFLSPSDSDHKLWFIKTWRYLFPQRVKHYYSICAFHHTSHIIMQAAQRKQLTNKRCDHDPAWWQFIFFKKDQKWIKNALFIWIMCFSPIII